MTPSNPCLSEMTAGQTGSCLLTQSVWPMQTVTSQATAMKVAPRAISSRVDSSSTCWAGLRQCRRGSVALVIVEKYCQGFASTKHANMLPRYSMFGLAWFVHICIDQLLCSCIYLASSIHGFDPLPFLHCLFEPACHCGATAGLSSRYFVDKCWLPAYPVLESTRGE